MENDDGNVPTQLALIKQDLEAINKNLDKIASLLTAQNGRLRAVEAKELVCQASGVIGLPERVRVLEDDLRDRQTLMRALTFLGGGGGLAGIASLLYQFLQMVNK